MRRYFGAPPAELSIQEQLTRDIATLERSMKKVRRKSKAGKSRTASRVKRKTNRTLKQRK